MSSKKEANIVVIEDNPSWQRTLKRNFSKIGDLDCNIIVVDNYINASNNLRKCYYHVAIVDLNLSDADENNRDGWRLITDVFPTLGVRTSPILLTGHGTMQMADKGLRKYGVVASIEKDTLDLNELRGIIKESAESNEKIRVAGANGMLFLKGGNPDPKWRQKYLDILKPEGAEATLNLMVNALITPFLPLIPKKDLIAFSIDTKKDWLQGDFWSRMIGKAIRIYIGTEGVLGDHGEKVPLDEVKSPNLILESLMNIRGIVKELSDQNFSYFSNFKVD